MLVGHADRPTAVERQRAHGRALADGAPNDDARQADAAGEIEAPNRIPHTKLLDRHLTKRRIDSSPTGKAMVVGVTPEADEADGRQEGKG